MMPIEQHSQLALIDMINELNERIAKLERDNILLAAEKTSLQRVVASLRYQATQAQPASCSNATQALSKPISRLLLAEA